MGTSVVSDEDLWRAKVAGWSGFSAGQEHLSVRQLGDGRAVYLRPLSFGSLRLGIGVYGRNYDNDVWDFQLDQCRQAWIAALTWDGEGEPEGWYRHPKTGRRRPGGDASKQYIHR